MFLIIIVTDRSCIPAGQRSLRLPLLCGEDGFSTGAADGRHSSAVSPVYTKISKILVIVHNVRGIWTIWCCWWWWRRALWKYGKEFTLSYNCIAATEPLSTILPIWRTNSSLWSNFFLSGKKALFALWFVDICWSNHRNIRLMLCKSRSCSNQTEVWELDHFLDQGFILQFFLSGKEAFSNYDLLTLVGPPEYPIDAPCKSRRFEAIKQKCGG